MRAVTKSFDVVSMIGDGASGSSKLLNFGGGVAGAGKRIELLVAMANAAQHGNLIGMHDSIFGSENDVGHGSPPGHGGGGGHQRATNKHLLVGSVRGGRTRWEG